MVNPLVVARVKDSSLGILPGLANRHGLITGATGTGKTVTLQVMAEQFSAAGVPVFVADVKGDLAGLGAAGSASEKMAARLKNLGWAEPAWCASPVVFWDVLGEKGHPARTTISEMGPLLLGRLLRLNETQQGVLTIAFKVADDHGLLLLDLKDLRALLVFLGEESKRVSKTYGNVSAASLAAIQRGLLEIEQQGGEALFGEPALDIDDLMQTDSDGRGVINVLAADKLLATPKAYAMLLLYVLSELFERLPEVGDPEKPKLVFFFDEAHLLFDEAPKLLIERIEQVVRLIRSKGVGVYFVTQNPLDVPETILGQLGNRVQHALRAFTPKDAAAVKAAAQTMRPNPAFDSVAAITELAVGEALVSFLDSAGRPEVVERAFICPPASRIGPLAPAERSALIAASPLSGHYEKQVDRESAYEKLTARASNAEVPPLAAPAPAAKPKGGALQDILFGSTGPRGGRREGVVEAVAKSAARSIGSQVGREIFRGVLGSLFGGRRR